MEIIIFLQALLLGIVEGITEFLPISSTGHLILLVDILGFNAVEGKVFEVVIQLGAILAICWYYRSKLLHIVFNFHRDAGDRKFIYLLLIAFAPAAIIGVFAHGYIKAVLFSPFVVAVMLIIGGILIIIIEKFKPSPTTNNIDKNHHKTSVNNRGFPDNSYDTRYFTLRSNHYGGNVNRYFTQNRR